MDTVKKAFEIIDYVLQTPDGVTASDVARKFNMSISNAYKYLNTLGNLGILIKQRDKRYTGGFKLIEYGYTILRGFDLRRIARPHLIDLLMKTGQTVHMIVREGFEGVYIEKLEGLKSLPMLSRVGMRIPLYSTALGKAILAYLPKDELDEYLEKVKLERRTENTITSTEKLRKELENIRKVGYAVDNEENEVGVKCLGAPILNHEGYPVASISISGVARRIDERLEEFGREVHTCAMKISKILGYRGKKND